MTASFIAALCVVIMLTAFVWITRRRLARAGTAESKPLTWSNSLDSNRRGENPGDSGGHATAGHAASCDAGASDGGSCGGE